MKKLILLLTVCLAMVWSSEVYATHLMGGDMTWTIVGPHQYEVSLAVYRDCNSAVVQPTSYRVSWKSVTCNDTGSFVVSVSSGYPTNVTDTCGSEHSTCDGGTVYGVQEWLYTSGVISLPAGCPDVILSWSSGNRNAVISNLTNPSNDALYINAEINTSITDNSPEFLIPLTVDICLGQMNYINQGGYDPDHDSLVYALDTAQGNSNGLGYPYVAQDLNYVPGYTPADPITNTYFNFNSSTGEITVFPTQTEYDVVKLIVYEYRGGVLIGHVERDMQVEVNQCTDTLPTISGVSGANSTDTIFTITACTSSCFTVHSAASDTSKTLTLSVTGQSSFPGATFTISSGKDPTLTFCWSPTRANAGTFSFTVTVKDNACPQPGQNTQSYTIIVPEVYPAGPDQTICQYTSVNARATGTGVWTEMSTNPVITTIANTTSPTTLISGFTSAGRYNYIWTSNTTCIDTMSIFVTSKPNAGADQTICQYSTATMAASGAGVWTALSSNPVTTTITNTALAATTITGFTVFGTYGYVWTSNGCTDTADVIVAAKPNGGPNQSICSNTTTVTMAASGTGTWTASASNPSVTVITTPASPITTITGTFTLGTYTYYWGSGCLDTVHITVGTEPNGGPNQTICQYTTVPMAATGTGTWTALSNNPSTTTIAVPTSASTSITGFTSAGIYGFLWSNGSCADTVRITVTAQPNGGPDQYICQYDTATMAASGTGTWGEIIGSPIIIIVPPYPVITNPTSPTTTITGFNHPTEVEFLFPSTRYLFAWTSNGCSDTVEVIVTAKPNAGPDQATCQYSTATMAAVGTGTWIAAPGNPSVVTFSNATSPTTSVSGLTAVGTYTLFWSLNGCSDTALINVTAKPNAGQDQTICQYTTASMAAIGSGLWTTLPGNPAATVIDTPTSPLTAITGFTLPGTYSFIWTENGCSDTANVIVTARPNAGADQITCQYSTAAMAATGAGIWTALSTNPATTVITTPASPNTVISGFSVAGIYSYIWTEAGCTDTANVTVTAKPNAGADQTICQYTTATMAATGSGTWTAIATNPATTIIATPSSPNTAISGFITAGTYGYIWTETGCSDTANVIVTAKPNAGQDQITCQYSTAAMAATGAGIWTALSTNPATTVITTPASPNTVISGFSVAGTYSYIWTENGCTDTANVNVIAKPYAGPDQTICQYTSSTSLAATGSGTWTADAGNPAVLAFANTSSPASSVSGLTASGTYALYWSLNGCSDTMLIHVTPKPYAGADQTICQYSTTDLTATGSGVWTADAGNPAAVIFVNIDSPATSVSGLIDSGNYALYWSLNGCSDTVLIHVTAKPYAGPDQTICQYTSSTSLAAIGSGTWTADAGNPAVLTFANTSSPASSVSGFTASGTYTLYWSQNGCSDTMLIHVTPKPNAGADQTICQYSNTNLTATGSGAWTAYAGNPAAVVFANIDSPATFISGFADSGTYTLFWSQNGCSDTVLIHVTGKPNAGPDQSFCIPGSTAIDAVSGPGIWTALSSNPTSSNIVSPASDTSGVNGISLGGYYRYIWTVNGCTDTMVVTAYPTIPSGPDQTTCQYSSITTAAFGHGTWIPLSNNPSTAIIANTTADTTSISGFNVTGVYGFVWSVSPCTDTMYVTVVAQPDAGPDQAACQYSTATMAATGAGTWTSVPANPATTIIVTPSSPVTVISGFTAPGTYSYIWTENGCSDTANVIVTAKPNAGADQTTCQFSTATMAGTGTGIWTAIPSNPATTIISSPISPVTTISGFSVAGIYGYIWTDAGCTDTANVIVTAKPNAGPDQITCQFSTATMAALDTGIWTPLSGNPVATVIDTPASPVTVIMGFSLPATYGYLWTANGCTDTANVIVTSKPNAGPDQSTCQFSTASMAAIGSGTWTLWPGNPAPTIIASPSSSNTLISGFSLAGTYGYIWTENGCTDTANVIVTAKPNAGQDQITCQYSTATMAAIGAGTWTAVSSNPATTVIETPSSPNTVISGFTVAGTYSYIWTEAGCTDTANVTVTAKPNAGADQTICQYTTATMAAIGSGIWTAMSTNPVPTIISTASSPHTVISGFITAGTYGYIWTENGCSDTTDVIVTAKPNAGPDQTTCQYSTATMAGTGTGTWAAQSSNPTNTVIATPASPNTVISGFSIAGTYSYIWTENGCTDTANVSVIAKPYAGPDQTICQYTSSTSLGATGSGTWTADAGNPAIVTFVNASSPVSSVSGFTASGTYTLYWSLNGCSDTMLIHVTPKPNAGNDQTICQYSTTNLTATGSGIWTAYAGNPAAVVFADIDSPTTSVSGFADSGAYTLYWSQNGCGDTVLIHVTAKPNAGQDQSFCIPGSTTIDAVSGPGVWTALSSNPASSNIVSPASDTSGLNGISLGGYYSYIWTVNGCTDTMVVTAYPTVPSGPDQTTCQYSSIVTAAFGHGTWIPLANNPAAAIIANTTADTTSISGFNSAGLYGFIWSVSPCTDTLYVTVVPKPNAGADQTICQYSTTSLAATVTGTWTSDAGNPAVVSFVNNTSPTTSVSGFNISGTYTLYWSLNGCSDTVLIHVTAKPDAGNDQTICQYSTTEMSATGTGVWTADAGNPAIVAFANVASPVTQVSGFTDSGTYTFYWSLNGCSDTVLIHVTAKPNAGADQTICQYSTTSLAATGTGTWTTKAGNPAVVIFANTSSPTSSVSGFNASGTYTLYWSLNGCSDTVLIHVTAKPNAGSDQTICQYSTTDLAASGTGAWTVDAGNPVIVTFANIASPVTQVSGFTDSGTYTFYWSLNGCSDTVLIHVTAKPNAGPDQTICQYSPTAMAATGSGTWTASASNPAAVAFADPVSPTTSVSGFSSTGTYTLYWSSNGCSDTVLVHVTAKPYAGTDQTICQYSTTGLAATGAGTWTADAGDPAVVVFGNGASSTSSVSGFTASGTYTLYWSLNGCSDTVLINVTAKPDAGNDQNLCLPGTITTAASAGAGLWSSLPSNPAGSTIASPTDPVTVISGFTTGGIYSYVWKINGCSDTMNVSVVPLSPAGPDQTICQYDSITTAAFGSGAWTILPGNPDATVIAGTSLDTTTISGFNTPGIYGYIWTVSGCTDTVYVTVIAKPHAGADQTICQYSTTAMAATGTGTWTADAGNPAGVVFNNAISPTTAVSGFADSGTYTLYWSLNGCSDTVLIHVTPKPNAGVDQIICQYSITSMAASGTGTWTTDAGNPAVVAFSSNTSANASVSGFTDSGTYTLYWSLNGCSDTVLIHVTAKPNAGTDQTICQYSTTALAATGAGTWTADAGNPAVVTFFSTTDPTSSVSGFADSGTYTLYWSLNGCSDTVLIHVTAKPNAGIDQTICQYSTTSMAASGTGTWTADAGNPAVVAFSSITSANASVSGFTDSGTYSLYWSLNGCSDTVLIHVTAKPNAGIDQTICQYSTTALAATGAGTWTADAGNPAVVTFSSTTDPTSSVSGFADSGIYMLYWSLNGCSDTVLIHVTAKPNAGIDQTICQYSTTSMAATGAGTWTADAGNPAVVTFTSITSATTSVSGFTDSGTYTLYWSWNGCSDTVLINVTAKPNAGPGQNVCQNATVTMAASGTGAWTLLSSNPSAASITNPASASTTVTGLDSVGTFGFIWTVNGCADTMYVVVNTQPTLSLGDTAICLNQSATLIPVAVPAGGSYLWSNNDVTASITVSPAATAYYTLAYTLGICTASITDSVQVHPLPVATVATIASVCTANNGLAIAQPSAGTPGYIYLWSASGGTGDTLSNLAPNTYQVTVTDINHCTTTASGIVVLQNPAIQVTELSQHDLKCFNDGSGDIYIGVSDTARNSGPYNLTYLWNGSISATADLTNVQAGTYTVNVSDQFGCTGTSSYILTQPQAITATTAYTDPQCYGYTDGSATVVAPSGGSGAYHYSWSTTPAQNTQLASNLGAGIYTASVTDDSLCLLTLHDTLIDPLAITFGAPVITNPSCYGDTNGTAQVLAQNGIGGYSYSWSDGQSSDPATDLAPGTLTVTVTDGNGCTATTTVALVPLTKVEVSITPTNVKCFGANDGSAKASASGGLAPYGYIWNNHDTTAIIQDLVIGTYAVTATDNNGCTASADTSIGQPTPVVEDLTSIRTSCPASADGEIMDSASGGTGTFTYTLDSNGAVVQTGNTTGTFTGLQYGTYTVIATDQNGCPVSAPISVPQAPFNYYTDTAISTTCYGVQYTDGIIHLQGYQIPNGPFQYSVDGGTLQYIPDFFNLSAGSHTVLAQDNYGCDTTFTVVVPSPPASTLQILPGDSTIAPGDTVQLSTVFTGYSIDSIKAYSWSPATGLSCIDCASPVASPYAEQNTYTLIVTYNQGCVDTASININVNGKTPVYIPNAFTPNGDGVNDVWMVFGTGIKDIKVLVFDRWGEKVFESNDQSIGWDGSYRGQLETPGVYPYVVQIVYLSGESESRQGSLTLIR